MRKDHLTDIGLYCLPVAFIACWLAVTLITEIKPLNFLIKTKQWRKTRKYLTIMMISVAVMMVTVKNFQFMLEDNLTHSSGFCNRCHLQHIQCRDQL